MTGYTPDPALEDATWERIVCSCGTVVGLTNGRLMRYRCIDRRCRKPGMARLSYIDMTVMPPREIASTHVPVAVERREGTRHGR